MLVSFFRQDIEVEESIKRRKYLEEDEIEIAEIAMAPTPAAPAKPKNTLPNLYPPGSQLTPDKVWIPDCLVTEVS